MKELGEYAFRINTCEKIGGSGALWLATISLFLVLLCIGPLLGQSAAIQEAVTPARLDASLAQARSLLDQGRIADADRAVREYLVKHLDSAEGHFLLGHILFREIQADARLERQLERPDPGPMAGVKILSPSSPDTKAREEKAKASLAEFTAGAKYPGPHRRRFKSRGV